MTQTKPTYYRDNGQATWELQTEDDGLVESLSCVAERQYSTDEPDGVTVVRWLYTRHVYKGGEAEVGSEQYISRREARKVLSTWGVCPAELSTAHCAQDLGEMIQGLRDRLATNAGDIQGRELTAVEEARFSVGMVLICDLMADLSKAKKAWESGHGAYRVTEQARGAE